MVFSFFFLWGKERAAHLLLGDGEVRCRAWCGGGNFWSVGKSESSSCTLRGPGRATLWRSCAPAFLMSFALKFPHFQFFDFFPHFFSHSFGFLPQFHALALCRGCFQRQHEGRCASFHDMRPMVAVVVLLAGTLALSPCAGELSTKLELNKKLFVQSSRIFSPLNRPEVAHP